jgi:hypothetical protein
MHIVGVYSFNYGKETITESHRPELDEVLEVVEVIDAEQYKSEISRNKTWGASKRFEDSGAKAAILVWRQLIQLIMKFKDQNRPCHSERSEESHPRRFGFFASLRMTWPVSADILAPQ